MTLNNPLDSVVQIVPVKKVMQKYHQPEEVSGYCQSCPAYGRNWSCPPLSFAPADYLERFSTVYIIATKLIMPDSADKQASLVYYLDCRRIINQRLLEVETQLHDSVVLISGHCYLCDDCIRPDSSSCNHPDRMRHSFVSLGFKVSGMIEDYFNDSLHWDRGQTPDSLYVVCGILSNAEISTSRIQQVVAGKTNSTQ